VSLEPDPILMAHVADHKAKPYFQAIPSQCVDCGQEFRSKTALDKHTREVHPKEPPFNDELREDYLKLVKNGIRPLKAARRVGVSPHTVKRAMKIDPSFDEAVRLAEEEYAEEVEEVLVDRALAGDPWAVKEFLTKRSKSRWSDDKTIFVHVQGEINHRTDLLPHEKDIMQLRQTIRERAALNGTPIALDNPEIIDVEIID
jgi:hypothetical protein